MVLYVFHLLLSSNPNIRFTEQFKTTLSSLFGCVFLSDLNFLFGSIRDITKV
jgi:hypothetical protein